MTEKDLLQALRHADKKYTDEAKARAAAAAEKKPHGIVMRTAAVAVSAAACFGLILFGLAVRQDPEITVADSDTDDRLTYALQTGTTSAEITPADAESAETTARVFVPEATGMTMTASGAQKTEARGTGQTEAHVTQEPTAAAPDRTAESEVRSTAAVPAEVQETSHTVTDRLTYQLIPVSDSGWYSAEKYGLANNVYRAEPGEKLKICMTVRNDPVTSGGCYSFRAEGMEIYGMQAGDGYNSERLHTFTTNNEYTFLTGMDTASAAADDSTVCSFFVDVPSKSGRYTVRLTPLSEYENAPLIYAYGKPREGYYNDPAPILDFTFYGLDILVGDAAMPDSSEPVTSEPYYNRLVKEGKLPNPDRVQYLLFDNIEYAVNRTAFVTEKVTAHAGDKKVPVRVFVQNNTGFTSCKLLIRYNGSLSICRNADGTPVYTVDPVFSECSCEADNDKEFSLDGGAQPNFTADGTVVTFYFDVPKDVSSGMTYQIRAQLEELLAKEDPQSDATVQVRDACAVDGYIRIVD